MSTSNVSLNFHETFSPQMIYVAKILNLAKQNYCGDKSEISNITGIPTGQKSGKVLPHIKYASFMGLISYESKGSSIALGLTDMGRIVNYNDPYILEDISKLLCNYWITDKIVGAPQWSFLFRNFSYQLENANKLSSIENKASEFFGKQVELGVVRNSYQNECFEALSIIDIEDSNKELVFNRLNHRYDCMYLYAYTLIKSWELYYPDISEITINQIIDEIKWNRPLGFDYDETLEVFDGLADLNILHTNKQLNPMTVVRHTSSKEILSSIYSLLI